MEVFFHFKNGQNTSFHRMGDVRVLAKNGMYKTTDKNTVEALLSSEIYKRGEVAMLTDDELVNNYLSGEEPDYLTKELLNDLPDQCIFELAEVCGTKNRRQLMIIKNELVREPITNKVAEVLKLYELKQTEENLLENAIASGVVTKNRQWYNFPDEWEEKSTNDVSHAAEIVFNHKDEI